MRQCHQVSFPSRSHSSQARRGPLAAEGPGSTSGAKVKPAGKAVLRECGAGNKSNLCQIVWFWPEMAIESHRCSSFGVGQNPRQCWDRGGFSASARHLDGRRFGGSGNGRVQFSTQGTQRPGSKETGAKRSFCGCGSVVEHHLAKVRVASSNLVIRSQNTVLVFLRVVSNGCNMQDADTVGWPRGEATACKAVYTGSNPVPTSRLLVVCKSHCKMGDWRSGSALP